MVRKHSTSEATETVNIYMEFTDNRFQKEIEIIQGQLMTKLMEGDKFKMNYSFSINYFGNIVDRFIAIRRILKRSNNNCVISAQITQLEHAESIIIELLKEFETLKSEIQSRKMD